MILFDRTASVTLTYLVEFEDILVCMIPYWILEMYASDIYPGGTNTFEDSA